MEIAVSNYSSAMSKFDYVDKQFVFIEGSEVAGDGGAGLWQYHQGLKLPPDGGTILRIGEVGSLSRVYSGALDVRWFGAVGDGFTDDTVSIAKALSAALAKGYKYQFGVIAPETELQGGNLYFPPGTYLVTSNLEELFSSSLLDRRLQGIRVFGVRFKSVILAKLTPDEFLFDSYKNARQTFFGIVFSDLAFVGGKTYGENGSFMRIWSDGQSGKLYTFERVHFENFSTVVSVEGRANGDIMAFYNCRFRKVTESVLMLNNPESVVHQFHHCELQGDAKAAFRILNGGCITWSGGSIVNGRSQANGGQDVDQWLIEYHGSSHGNNRTVFENVRFERRGIYSKLVKAHKASTTRTTFQNCTWAGPRDQGTPRTVVDLHGQHVVEFIRCGLYINAKTERDYRYKLRSHKSGPFESSQPVIRFLDCEMPPPSIEDFDFGKYPLSGVAVGSEGFATIGLTSTVFTTRWILRTVVSQGIGAILM